MGHRHDILVQSVMRHQQPAGKTLLDIVQPIARRGLSAQIQQPFNKPQEHGPDGGTLIECRFALCGRHPQRVARHLNDGLVGRHLPTQEPGAADDPLDPDIMANSIEIGDGRALLLEHLFLR